MVEYERRGEVAVVTIDRPERRNAIDRETARELTAAWRRFDDDDRVRVGVLTGAGGTFSAGGDLKTMAARRDGEDGPADRGPLDVGFGFTHLQVGKPTVAAIEGYCVAGGLEVALWCDLRVAGEGAAFGCFERRFGVPLVDGGTQRLPRVVGLGRALDLILTGREIDAETAREWGLANRVVPDGEALDAAVDLGETIAGFPWQTVLTDRAAVYEGLGSPVAQGLAIEALHGSRTRATAREGAARFAEGGEGRHGEGVPGSE